MQQFARQNGLSVAEYLEECHKQAAGRETGGTSAGATEEPGRDGWAEARQRDMLAFLEAYPQVKPEEIPRQVWEQVHRGKPLTAAYSAYRKM